MSQGGPILSDEDIDKTAGTDLQEIGEIIEGKKGKARSTAMEMIGDVSNIKMAPSRNTVCA